MAARTLPQFLLDPGRRAALVAATVWGFAVPPAVSQALGQAAEVHRCHVHALDAKAAALLREGRARSATFEGLLDVLEDSDVFVFVETGFLAAPSQLTFTGVSRTGRLVRITLSVPEACDRLLAWLAHELQHAVEVASAPEVTSAAALRRFYYRHGVSGYGEGHCTPEAQRVTKLVLDEVAARQRAQR
jgi:hypothetical protein